MRRMRRYAARMTPSSTDAVRVIGGPGAGAIAGAFPAARTILPNISPAKLRAALFGAIKFPLMGRYAVRWRWPRTVDLRAWERLAFESGSGARIAALYAPAAVARKGVVVCAHPLRRDAKGFFLSTGRADVLRRHGYDVLLFDFNGFGESSSGDFRYVRDLLAAAAVARERAGGLPVHALAACFGAVWTLGAAALDDTFSRIVLEAPLSSMRDYLAADPLGKLVFELAWRLFPGAAAHADPLAAAAKIAGAPRLLFITGEDDLVAPPAMAERLRAACGLPLGEDTLWRVAGAAHLRAFEAAPEAYARRVIAFLDGADAHEHTTS